MFNRVKNYGNLYCIREFKKPAIKVDQDASFEYEHLKQNALLCTVTRNNMSVDTITVFVHNVQ